MDSSADADVGGAGVVAPTIVCNGTLHPPQQLHKATFLYERKKNENHE